MNMSTERRKSKKRLTIWFVRKFGVMLRAARKQSGNATSEANSVPTKAMTTVCSSLVHTSRCCHSAL
ncbi:hypothetical protein D3C87_2008260 [compost metagenome]